MALWNFLLWKAFPALHKSLPCYWPSFCDDDDSRETQDITFTSVILTHVSLPYFLCLCLTLSLVAHICDIKEGKGSF